jgi:hypothetical protein
MCKALLRVRDEKVVENLRFIFTVVNFLVSIKEAKSLTCFATQLFVNSLPKKKAEAVSLQE